MKKRELLFASMTLICLLSVGISFFKMYASAERRLDEVLVDTITLPAASNSALTKEVLFEAAHVNQMPQVTKVEVPKLAFMQHKKPGQYQVPLKIYVHFDKVLSRKITVNLVDQTPPVIEQKKPLQIAYGTKINWMGYVHILDNVDKTILVAKSQISRVDTKKVGKQKVTIKVKDKANNVTKKEFEVEVMPKAPNKTTAPSQNIQHDSVNRASAPQTAKTGEQFQKADQISNTAEKREIPNTSKLKSALQFNGLTVPYRHMQGASSAPETGAATWNGTGLVNDGAPTHFIGHNPGDFHSVMELYVGAPITVYDDNGNQKTYHVYEVVDVTDEGYNANDLKDDVLPRMLDETGERISLQTCINEQINRCILAR